MPKASCACRTRAVYVMAPIRQGAMTRALYQPPHNSFRNISEAMWIPSFVSSLRCALRLSIIFVLVLPLSSVPRIARMGTHLENTLAMTTASHVECRRETGAYLFDIGILLEVDFINLLGSDWRLGGRQQFLQGLVSRVVL